MKTIACSKIDIKILLKCAELFKVEKNEHLVPLSSVPDEVYLV